MSKNSVLVVIGVVLLVGVLLLVGGNPGAQAEKLRVVTSVNVIADLVRSVGGDRVEVRSLIRGLETPHTFEPKTSDIRDVAWADLLFRIGLGLEVWSDRLILSAGNENLKVVTLSEGMEISDGNPHVWLSLKNAALMVQSIAEALAEVSPENRVYFEARAASYLDQLEQLKEELAEQLSSVEDRRVVSFPASYPYLFKEFGIEEVARGEETHGQEPSAKRMASLVKLIRESRIRVIVAEKQFSDQLPRTLAQESGAKIVYLTPLLGGLPGTDTYLDMMRYNLSQLAATLGGRR